MAANLNSHFYTTGRRIQENIDDPGNMPLINPLHRAPFTHSLMRMLLMPFVGLALQGHLAQIRLLLSC